MAVSLSADIRALVDYASGCGLVDPADGAWARNSLLEAVGADGCAHGWSDLPESDLPEGDLDLEAVLGRLADVAVANGLYEDTAGGRDRAAMAVMGRLVPRPSVVDAAFRAVEASEGPRAATDWFYRLCCDAGYVRRAAIARNVAWVSPTRWGDLQITINLSKPEKDPRDIASAGAAPADGDVYPACQLCVENEGYPGRPASSPFGDHPARQNLRIVPVTLQGEPWGLQYSPYAYFGEHCIVMSREHRPMHVDRTSMACLLDLLDRFPRYFFGSNADLPVVGGSILSHDHFQGGRHVFPMMEAPVEEAFSMEGCPGVDCAVVRWPLSVIRLESDGRDALLDAACRVLDRWRTYDDPAVGVLSRTGAVPHNTVTPIVYRVGDRYRADLALRCNVTSDEHPLGVFHPHEEWHHIKKENIGLIEVMGLAILPPRLVPELAAVARCLVAGTDPMDDPEAAPHGEWARGLAGRYPGLTPGEAESVVRGEAGDVFAHVLEDAGVFKWDEAGRAAQRRFLEALA